MRDVWAWQLRVIIKKEKESVNLLLAGCKSRLVRRRCFDVEVWRLMKMNSGREATKSASSGVILCVGSASEQKLIVKKEVV